MRIGLFASGIGSMLPGVRLEERCGTQAVPGSHRSFARGTAKLAPGGSMQQVGGLEILEGLSDRLALVDGNASHSRRDLAQAVEHLSRRLRDGGLAPGDVVLIAAPLRGTTVIALLAAREVGAVACPVDPVRAEEVEATMRPRARL